MSSESTCDVQPVDCDRCGSDYRLELCVIWRGDPETTGGVDRDRIEAHLCYQCRQDVTCEPLGAAPEVEEQ